MENENLEPYITFNNGGQPALNDTNVNNMQKSIKQDIITKFNNLKQTINGTVLYENATGTNGNVTFEEQIAEGDSIEIIYCRRKTDGTSIIKSTGRLPFTNSMITNLDINYYSSSSVQQSMSKEVQISTTGISVSGETTWSNTNFTTSTNIYILKVVKYEEA